MINRPTIQVYEPTFSVFHGRDVVTWEEGGNLRVGENLLEQYRKWLASKAPKDAPPEVFWQSLGPAIARALWHCDAKALVVDWNNDRSVGYIWFSPSTKTSMWHAGKSWYDVRRVSATKMVGSTRVMITLDDGDEVTFVFSDESMARFLRPPEAPAAPTPESP